jgi:peptidoglycan/LPS O-acetylase OafA/YrhL
MSLASPLAPAADAPGAAPSPAVAPPPGNPRFALFDSLRGLAVFAILVFHVAEVTGALNTSGSGDLIAVVGNEALIVFFAVSGFLIYRPYALAHAKGGPLPSTLRYGRRRVLRILPAYWTALTLLAIWPGITGVFTHEWWRYYFFLQPYSARTLGQGIPVAWSLCVEVSFYFALPLWAALVRRVARPALSSLPWIARELIPLAFVALLGVAIQVAASRLKVSSLLTTTLLGECVWFSIGMALAIASIADERARSTTAVVRAITEHPLWCWIGAAACIAVATVILHPGGLFNIIVSLHTAQPYARTLAGIALNAAACALLIAPAVFGEHAGGIPRRVLAWGPLAWLGLVSYAAYLYHLAVVELLGETTDPAHFSATGLGLVNHIHTLTTPILVVLSLAVMAAVAAVSYYVVELPFLKRKERSVRAQSGGEPQEVVEREQDQPVV